MSRAVHSGLCTLLIPWLSSSWCLLLTQLQTQDGSQQTPSHAHCAECQQRQQQQQQQQTGSLPKSPAAGLQLTFSRAVQTTWQVYSGSLALIGRVQITWVFLDIGVSSQSSWIEVKGVLLLPSRKSANLEEEKVPARQLETE